MLLRPLFAAAILAAVSLPAFALPTDANLRLDPTYGLFPRPQGHQFFPSPTDWRDINIYQLFTDRFADGDSANNTSQAMGINRTSWFVNNSGRQYPFNRNFHHGGDWKGLKDNLNYLTGMGVNAVWISGVQMNAQGRDGRYTPYHQYHPTDFFNVDPAQGTFQELKDLIDACHARGIYVILDVVINHTADLTGLFGNNREDDKRYWPNGNDSFNWWDNNRKHPYPFSELTSFHRNGTINNWDAFPETLRGQFRGTDDLATDSGHVTYWITEAFKNLIDATDCDGFRVDAIKHVEYNWVKKWADDIRKHAVTKGKNDFILFGELFVYDNNALASYCKELGYSFNSALFFPMSQTIKGVFVDGQGTGQLTQALNAKTQYGEGENRLVTFIDNHDVNRISIQNGGDTGNDVWKLRPALSFLYLATPVPCLYYGTEHAFNQGNHFNGQDASQNGYEGLGFDDADWQRECMFDRGFQPGPAQGNKLAATDAPLYQHIAKLNAARKAHPALTRGSFTERWQSGSAGAYAFTRVLLEQEALVALNTSDNAIASINPIVGKPNGTEFFNVLNPSEKVTVSGGRIAFPLAGKDTKIFVAGSLAKASEARATSDATNVTITYTPNDGPLKTSTAPIQIGLKIDGGTEQFGNMTAGPNGIWTYTRPYAGITSNLTVAFRDSATIPVLDRTGGTAWIFDATKFGQSLITWVGNTVTFPSQGNITASADLWIDVEAFPKDAAAGGKIVYTTDNGTSWSEVPLTKARVVVNNDLLNANLGKFPGGTTLKFAVQVVDTNGVARWDNNNGLDYTRSIQFGTLAIGWSGRVNHWPLDGAIESTTDFWINIESWPQGAGIGGEVVYSTDNGTTFLSKPLAFRNAQDNNDFWNCNLGTFPAGTKLKYAVKLTDTTGKDYWHNNSEANFSAAVNGLLSSLTEVDPPRATGLSIAEKPRVALRFTGNGSLVMDTDGRNNANTYTIEQADSLTGNWTTLRTVPPGAIESVWDLLTSSDLIGKTRKFFRVRAAGGTSDQVIENNPARLSISANKDGATAANLVYTTDGGQTWLTTMLLKTDNSTNMDTWSINLPAQPSGTTIQYAIELVDQQGNSRWMNNGGNDYRAPVYRPGQTDVIPPSASHSPTNTITTAASLVVTLTATDDSDPAPKIRYTTDGSAPSSTSTLYSGPLTITANTTLRYFAIDSEGNQSPAESINIIVKQTVNFGAAKPYSTNPSLGKSVANGAITADGINNGEWTDDKLIALGMANDDPRSLGSNWTMHEAPINLTHIWAAWDETHLYVAWQFVDVTDKIDPSNAGGAGGSRIGSNDGILQWIALDTKSDAGAAKDMWKKNGNQTLWNGTNKPDFQIYLAGSLWQGFISRAINNIFPVDDGGVNYFNLAGAGITAGKGARFAGTSLWGVADADDRRKADAPARNFATEGHDTARDSFYEIKIPLAFLGLSKAQLESQGLGIMIGAGSNSCVDVLPQDDGATLNTAGVETWNSSLEWGDIDSITTPFARIGSF
jgi:glycosidase